MPAFDAGMVDRIVKGIERCIPFLTAGRNGWPVHSKVRRWLLSEVAGALRMMHCVLDDATFAFSPFSMSSARFPDALP